LRFVRPLAQQSQGRGTLFHTADNNKNSDLQFCSDLQPKKIVLSNKNCFAETGGNPFLYSELVCQLNSLLCGSEMEGDGGLVGG